MMLLNDFFQIKESMFARQCPCAVISLNAQHEIYKAHFPGEPITPGVCQIQIVTEILSIYLNAEVALKEVKNVKYLSVISPEKVDNLCVVFNKVEREGSRCKVQARFELEGIIYSRLSLTFHVLRNSSDI